MILSLMVASTVIGGVLAGAALLIERVQRGSNNTTRWVWAASMLLTVALTVVLPVRRIVEITGVSATTTPEPAQPMEVLGAAVGSVLRLPLQTVTAPLVDLPPRVDAFALTFWIASAAICLALLASMYGRLRLARNQWQVEQLHGHTVHVARHTGPAVVGLFPMRMVVPQWIRTRPDTEQLLVLAHEAEHVRARDPFLLLGGCVAIALMPWNVAMWFALARLRLAIEIDCDRRVIAHGASLPEYGRLLLELSALAPTRHSIIPALSSHRSHLERRLVAMTSHFHRPLHQRAAITFMAAGIVVAACRSELPAPSSNDRNDIVADYDEVDAGTRSAAGLAVVLRGLADANRATADTVKRRPIFVPLELANEGTSRTIAPPSAPVTK